MPKAGTNGPGCTGWSAPWGGTKNFNTEPAGTNDSAFFDNSVHSSKHDLIYGCPDGIAEVAEDGTTADGKKTFRTVACNLVESFRGISGVDHAAELIGSPIIPDIVY